MKNHIFITLFIVALILLPHARAASPGERVTIIDAAESANMSGAYAGQFDMLLMALGSQPDIQESLSGNGEFTVFAPTDSAFENLLACLGVPNNELLNAVLRYHVVRGRRDSRAVIGASQFRTLLGAFVEHDALVLTDNAGELANITVPDVAADNGVIHGVDKVLLPFPVQCS